MAYVVPAGDDLNFNLAGDYHGGGVISFTGATDPLTTGTSTGTAWTNVDNARNDDGSFASVTVVDGWTNDIKFPMAQFDVPDDAYVTNVEVRFDARVTSSGNKWMYVIFSDNGTDYHGDSFWWNTSSWTPNQWYLPTVLTGRSGTTAEAPGWDLDLSQTLGSNFKQLYLAFYAYGEGTAEFNIDYIEVGLTYRHLGNDLQFEMESTGIVQVPLLTYTQVLSIPVTSTAVSHLAFIQTLVAPSVQAGGAGTGLMMH